MKKAKDLEIMMERTIQAAPAEAFRAWMDPKTPGTPWNMGDRLILQPKVDGLFYWLVNGTPHYGRYVKLKRGALIQHTWMSPYTEGRESMVTVAFKKQGGDTLMTLTHTGLPDNENGRAHQGGWHEFLDAFPTVFETGRNRKKAKRGVPKPK